MALVARNITPASGLAEALRVAAPWLRQPRQQDAETSPQNRVQGIDERLGGQALDRSKQRAARSVAVASDATRDAADTPARATVRQTVSATGVEASSRPIAYTAVGAAVYESLPRGVFLDIII